MEQEEKKTTAEFSLRKTTKRKALIIPSAVFLILILNEIFLPHTSFLENKEVEISPGLGSRKIGQLLKREGVIRSKWIFVFYATLWNEASDLKPGTYVFSERDSLYTVEKTLFLGGKNEISAVIPEGWDSKDIAVYLNNQKIVDQKKFLELAGGTLSQDYDNRHDFLQDRPSGASLEGYLFPDTYRLAKGTNSREIISKFLANFDRKLTPELRREIAKQKKTIFETITMASLIEKEVVSEDDRALVSGILWKRLQEGMPLQVDATLVYVKSRLYDTKDKNSQRISDEDKKTDSPYNTYKYPGLPQGPIANPGLSSLKAAVYPKESVYYYYLSAPDGQTVFSRTLEEHNLAKAKYLK